MCTMTISEAGKILNIVYTEIQRDTGHRHHPVSALKGYDLHQICTAMKLQIANALLIWADRDDFEEKFAALLKHSDVGSGIIQMSFVPDDQLDVVGAEMAFDLRDERYLNEETAASFGKYCKWVGSNDPFYWKKIYARLGLEYTSESPRGNKPACPF